MWLVNRQRARAGIYICVMCMCVYRALYEIRGRRGESIVQCVYLYSSTGYMYKRGSPWVSGARRGCAMR